VAIHRDLALTRVLGTSNVALVFAFTNSTLPGFDGSLRSPLAMTIVWCATESTNSSLRAKRGNPRLYPPTEFVAMDCRVDQGLLAVTIMFYLGTNSSFGCSLMWVSFLLLQILTCQVLMDRFAHRSR